MDSLECYIQDLVDCYNDLINQYLPCLLTTVAAIVVMILCALKMTCGRQMRRIGCLGQNSSQASHAEHRNTYLNQSASQISYANTVPTSAGTRPRKRESELRDRGVPSICGLGSALNKKQSSSETVSSQKSRLSPKERKVTGYEESIEPSSQAVLPSSQKNSDGSGQRCSSGMCAMEAKPNTRPASTPVNPLVTQSNNNDLGNTLVKRSYSGNLSTSIIKVRYAQEEDLPEVLLSVDDKAGTLHAANNFDDEQIAHCTCGQKSSKTSKKVLSGQRRPCNKPCDCYKNHNIKNMGSVIIRRSPRSLSPKRSKMGQHHSKTQLKKETSCCSACCGNKRL